MSTIRTSLPVPIQPWEAARTRFLVDLSPEEHKRFQDATLENLFYDASATQKKHAHHSRSWLLQERLSSLVDAIDDYGKALDIYSNTYSLILCPIWGSLRVVLHIASEAGKFQDNITEILGQIGDAVPRFRIYQTLFKNHDRLALALSTAYLDILRFCVIIKDFFKSAKRSRIPFVIVMKGAWRPFRRDFDQQIVRFRQHSKLIEREAGLAHMIENARTRDIQIRNQALQIANNKIRRRHRILAALPAVNYGDKHANFSAQRHQGTNEWIRNLPQFTSWISRPTSACVCCYGIPGSGKSTLAASVIDHLLSTPCADTMICYYYCDYADTVSLNPEQVVASLIKQVIVWLPLDEFVEEFQCPYEEGKPAPSFAQSSNYLAKVLQKFLKVYLVIDGIDELSQDSQVTILDLVNLLISNSSVVNKVYLTSRTEEYYIKKAMESYPTFHLKLEYVSKDISLFINDRIGRLGSSHPLLQCDDLRQEVIEALLAGAHGMFLWVRFQLYEIQEACSEESIRELLQHLPRSLEETYDRIIIKIHRGPGGRTKFELMKKVFCWVAGALRPLQIEELEEAVGLEPMDTFLHAKRTATGYGQRLVSSCGNLVTYNIETGNVTFAHYTVRKYLYSQQPAAMLDLLLELQPPESYIAQICTAYLSFSDFDTQLTKYVEPLEISSDMTQELIWASVPLASRFRGAFSWALSTTRVVKTQTRTSVKLALPRTAQPTDVLSRKYALLGYIVDHWISHTVDLRPHSPEWARFKHLVLYRQMDFEYRPWNDHAHCAALDVVISDLQQTWEQRYDRRLTPPDEECLAHLKIYSWSFKHAIGSLLALTEPAHLKLYLDWVQMQQVPANFESNWIGTPKILLILARLPVVTPRLRSSMGWSGDLLYPIIRAVVHETGRDDTESVLDFLMVEYCRWKNTLGRWNDIVADAAILALQCNDWETFEFLWKACVDDYLHLLKIGLTVADRTKMSDGLLMQLLRHKVSKFSEWDLIFFLDNYLFDKDAQRLTSFLLDVSEFLKPVVYRALVAIALARNVELRAIQRFLSRSGSHTNNVKHRLPTGDWKETKFGTLEVYQSLLPFLKMDIFVMVRQLDSLRERWCATQCTERDTRRRVIRDLISLWNANDRVFDMEIFEKSKCHFLEWTMEHRQETFLHDIIPLYEAFVSRDGSTQRRVARNVFRFASHNLFMAERDELFLLPWTSSVAAMILEESSSLASPSYIPDMYRDRILKSLGMKLS